MFSMQKTNSMFVVLELGEDNGRVIQLKIFFLQNMDVF